MCLKLIFRRQKMNKWTISISTVFMLILMSSITFSAETKRYISRSELEKMIEEKDAEIKRLKEELEALKAKYGLNVDKNTENIDISANDNDVDKGTRRKPANYGDVVKANIDRWDGKCVFEIELLEVIRGNEALKLIKKANHYNDNPSVDKEYIMAKFRCKNLKDLSEKDNAFELRNSLFDFASSDDKIIDTDASVASFEPQMSAELFEGAEHVGWVFFLADKKEKSPKVVFAYGTDKYLWFNLDTSLKSDNGNLLTTNKINGGNITDKLKVLSVPFFGIKLGVSLEDVKKHYNIDYNEELNNELCKAYSFVDAWQENVHINFQTFQGKVCEIQAIYTECNAETVHMIRRQIEQKYNIQPERTLAGAAFYELEIDDKIVKIQVTPVSTFCSVNYSYSEFCELINEEIANKKMEEMEPLLKGL